MRLQTYRGYRIRASDKSLVFRFSAGLLLLLFLAVTLRIYPLSCRKSGTRKTI